MGTYVLCVYACADSFFFFLPLRCVTHGVFAWLAWWELGFVVSTACSISLEFEAVFFFFPFCCLSYDLHWFLTSSGWDGNINGGCLDGGRRDPFFGWEEGE